MRSRISIGLLLAPALAFSASCSSAERTPSSSPGADAGPADGSPGIDASFPLADGGMLEGDGSGSVTDSGSSDVPDVSRPLDPCVEAGSCGPGTWTDVTPSSVSLDAGSCGNYGTKGVQVDPIRAEDVYVEYNCQGIWKSTDYGQTWNGPINTGQNGSAVSDCAGSIAIARSPSNPDAILYESCIRGTGLGFWKSTNAGVDWTNFNVLPDGGAPSAVNQQYYSPAVDPYDADHLLMSQHETDVLVESTDGGQTWTSIVLDPSMITSGDTGGIDFINTGDASTTRTTWLWLSAASAGTWRTSDGGGSWTQVETNEHVAGSMHSEVFQPTPYTSGLVYMAGEYSSSGSGVLVSQDFGKTWAHVGQNEPESTVVATSKNVYAAFGWAAGPGTMVSPGLEVTPVPGTGSWSSPGTPTAMTQGPGHAALTNDGTYNIVFLGNYNAGLWRYVEPSQ